MAVNHIDSQLSSSMYPVSGVRSIVGGWGRGRYCLRCGLVFAVAVAIACGDGEEDSAFQQSRESEASTTEAPSELGQSANPLDSLIENLRDLRGSFVNVAPGRWDFAGDRSALVAFEEFRDSAVVRLVDCLDRTELAAATVQEQQVPMGYMCYAALARVAYYEWHQYQDVVKDPSWPGEVAATASVEDLRQAKTAWLQVVEKHLYFLH